MRSYVIQLVRLDDEAFGYLHIESSRHKRHTGTQGLSLPDALTT